MKNKKYLKVKKHDIAKKIGFNIARGLYFTTCMGMVICFYYMMYLLIMAI